MRVLTLAMSLLLAACTAPTTQGNAGAQHADAAPGQQPASQQRPTGKPVKMPPLGGPLPPERVQGYCEADADCSVRASRDGCAACVSRHDAADAPPSSGATCGMQETDGCRCIDHRCAAKPRMIDSPIGQAVPESDTP